MATATPEKDESTGVEYSAQVNSKSINGAVILTIGKNSFKAASAFEAIELPFVEIKSINTDDYDVVVITDYDTYTFSRMGSWCKSFYDALCEAYHSAVLRAFFEPGKPLLSARGDYHIVESNREFKGSSDIFVYDDCVVILPPNLNARRIPLCFLQGIDKGPYEVTLHLDANESYCFSKLGYDMDPFVKVVEAQSRALREAAVTAAMEIDPLLTSIQASQIARLIPKGSGAPLGAFAEIAPSFVAALEQKIASTRAKESYETFTQISDPSQIWVGFRKNDISRLDASDTDDLPEQDEATDDTTGNGMTLKDVAALSGKKQELDSKQDPYLFWMIAPSKDQDYAAVEFAVMPGESAATFVYKTNGDFVSFASRLNRALEAIDFKREVIRLTDEELQKPEYVDYLMAAKRTASLRFIRKNFVGRALHRSHESWKSSLLALFGDSTRNL